MDTENAVPAEPLWRHISHLRLLLPLFEVGPNNQHAEELEFLYHMQQHLSLLVSGAAPALNPDLKSWGPGTIDAVSQAFINNRGFFIWGISKLGPPSNKERFKSKLTLFLYFLVSLTQSPDTSELFREGGAYAASADVPDIAFYRCLTHAFILLANYPAVTKLTRKSNLTEKRVNMITLEIPDVSISPGVSTKKTEESGLTTVMESTQILKAVGENGKNDLLQSKCATATPAPSSRGAVACRAGKPSNNGGAVQMVSDEMLPPFRNSTHRATAVEKIQESDCLTKKKPPLASTPLVTTSVQREVLRKPDPQRRFTGRATSTYNLSQPARANDSESPELISLVNRSNWETRPRVPQRTRLDIAKWLEHMENIASRGGLEDNGDPE